MLDRHVQRFLESESCDSGTRTTKSGHHAGFGLGLPTLGVRVKCRGEKSAEVTPSDTNPSRNKELEDEEDEGESEEDDELIWWSWDGKLVGFTE